MRFASRTGQNSRGGSQRRSEKHSIVGLSGWLFADLLLAVAVIFLVAQDTAMPMVDPAIGDQSAGDLSVVLRITSDLDIKDGSPRWDGTVAGTERGVTIEARFSRPIRGFGDDANGRLGDIKISGDSTGWYTEEVVEVSDSSSADGTTWSILLAPNKNYTAGTVQVQIPKAAAVDSSARPNEVSNEVRFEALIAPETVLDVDNAVQIEIPRPSGGCVDDDANISKQGIAIASIIERIDKFDTEVASDDKKPQSENFVQWVSDKYAGRARVGFLFVYGPDRERGREVAKAWKNCVEQSLVELGYISQPGIPTKFFEDKGLGSGRLKLEMYFFVESVRE